METQTVFIEGMTCVACEYKIRHVLGQIPHVNSVLPDFGTGLVELSVEQEIPISTIEEVLRPHAKYRLRTIPVAQQQPSWLAQYYPLLLIFAFITGTAFVTAFHGNILAWEHWSVRAFLHNFMTGFFLVFSFFKLLNIKDFAQSFAMYDVAAMRFPVYGKIYPFLELALGVLCLLHFWPSTVYWADIVLMGFGNIGVIASVLNKQKIQCACLGAVFNLPMSQVTIIENTIMVLVGIILLTIQ